MRNLRALIAYDGSGFHGWQRQDGFRSVQEAVEEALGSLVGEAVVVQGAGRTDAGVHALGQVAHFHLDSSLGDDRLRHALNFHLPPGVVVRRLESCRESFHARFDARSKRYAYLVLTTRFRPPFASHLAHWTSDVLDFEAMRRAARELVGSHDFGAFASAGSPRKSNVRRVSALHLVRRRERFWFVVEANGFLYNMVRAFAGTLLDVGRGKLTPEDVVGVLASQDRRASGPTAPAAGLYLLRVRYAEPAFAGRDRGPRGVPGTFDY